MTHFYSPWVLEGKGDTPHHSVNVWKAKTASLPSDGWAGSVPPFHPRGSQGRICLPPRWEQPKVATPLPSDLEALESTSFYPDALAGPNILLEYSQGMVPGVPDLGSEEPPGCRWWSS